MNNNNILIRIRYALNLKDEEMQEIFKLGGVVYSLDEINRILIKVKEDPQGNPLAVDEDAEERITCTNLLLETFLNGFIIYKKGPAQVVEGQPERPQLTIKENGNVNNVLLKKLKIALSLQSDDMIDIFEVAGLNVTKSELSALFRKEGHKHYRECGDNFARNFIKGLTLTYRK